MSRCSVSGCSVGALRGGFVGRRRLRCGEPVACVVGVAVWVGSCIVGTVVVLASRSWLFGRGRVRRRFSVRQMFAGLHDVRRFGRGCITGTFGFAFGLQLKPCDLWIVHWCQSMYLHAQNQCSADLWMLQFAQLKRCQPIVVVNLWVATSLWWPHLGQCMV